MAGKTLTIKLTEKQAEEIQEVLNTAAMLARNFLPRWCGTSKACRATHTAFVKATKKAKNK